jgi:hypothetical protein
MKDQLDISRHSENAAHREAAKEKAARPSDSADCSRRFFIAQPGTLLGPLGKLQAWHEWEVGDSRDQSRVCLTSCKRKAELIRDALEYHGESERLRMAIRHALAELVNRPRPAYARSILKSAIGENEKSPSVGATATDHE